MDIKALHTLQAIVSHGSFANAGKAVGLSVSGVSLQIRALEKEFDVILFDRSARPPKLTLDGHKLVEHARDILTIWSKMHKNSRHEPVSGVLRVGAVHTVVSGILPFALTKLRARLPALEIQLTTGLAHELEAGLRRGNLDVAVLAQDHRMQPGLAWQPICLEPLVVVASAKTQGDSDHALLRSRPFIRFRRVAWSLTQLIDQELASRGVDVMAAMEVDTLEGILSLVGADLGISIVPFRTIPDPFPRDVRWIPFGNPPVTRSIGVFLVQNNPRRDLVQRLYDDLVSVSQEHPPPFGVN